MHLTFRADSRLARIFPGWGMVAAGFVQNIFAFGIWVYGFGVLFRPMSTEMGWTATQTAGAFTLRSYQGGIEGPLVGWLLDRYGPRAVMLGAYVLGGLGLIGLAFSQDLPSFYILVFLISLGTNAGTYQSQYKGLAAWFKRRRGLAFGLLAIGGGLGGAVLGPVVAELVVRFGWRVTVAILGGVILMVGVCMSVLFRPGAPERYGLHADGDPQDAATEQIAPVAVSAAESRPATFSFTLKEALSTRTFWFLNAAFALHNLSILVILTHGVNLATGLGISITAAAAAFGAMAAISLPLRLFAPVLADRFNIQWTTIGCLLLSGLGVAVLSSATDLSGVWLAVILYGSGYAAAAPLFAAILVKYFGARHFGALFGCSFLLQTLGSGWGPLLAGYVYDTTHSYSLFLHPLAAAYVVAIALTALAGPPRRSETPRYEQVSW